MNKADKRALAGLLALTVLCTGGCSLDKLQKKEDSEPARTRDYTVTKGDITVGLTESGTVSLNREYVTFAANAEVAEIYAKIGVTVSEGDNIARFNTDDISDVCSNYEKKIADAKLSYSQAEIEAKTKKTSAEQT